DTFSTLDTFPGLTPFLPLPPHPGSRSAHDPRLHPGREGRPRGEGRRGQGPRRRRARGARGERREHRVGGPRGDADGRPEGAAAADNQIVWTDKRREVGPRVVAALAVEGGPRDPPQPVESLAVDREAVTVMDVQSLVWMERDGPRRRVVGGDGDADGPAVG